MKKVIIPSLIVLIGVFGIVMAADYTPMSEEDTTASLVRGSIEVNGDITLANDETIDNATDSQVQVTFDDDAVVLGTIKAESENAAANVADGDEIRYDTAAQNDATQEVTYARIIVDLDDVSDTTEDSSYEIWVYKAGTLTQTLTVDATGIAVVGDVSGTTIGGVTEANVLDKSATETVSGDYTFSGALISSGTVTLTDTLAAGTTTATATNAPALVAADAPAWVEVTIGGEIYVIPAYQVND